MPKHYDVFISHASEDKECFVFPLAEALQREGLRVWLDEFELMAGCSLREQIDKGLANSSYGIVVFSPAFFEKPWPRNEFNTILNLDIAGRIRIIPIWHNVTVNDVVQYSPLAADRYAIRTTAGGAAFAADKILRTLRRDDTLSKIPLSDTMTSRLAQVINSARDPRDLTDFLLIHETILTFSLAQNYKWCTAREFFKDYSASPFDFLLGVSKPCTEPVWRVAAVMPITMEYPISGSSGKPGEMLASAIAFITEILNRKEAKDLVNALLAYNNMKAITKPEWFSIRPPIMVTGRRARLDSRDIRLIRTINAENSVCIHTYDWLLDGCRRLEFGQR